VLLARVVLHEPLTPRSIARVVAALAGAMLVLADGGGHDAAQAAGAAHASLATSHALGLPEALALVGGFSFALNNVMLRRGAALPEEGRALAMFLGGAVVAGVVAGSLSQGGAGVAGVQLPTGLASWALPAFGLALAFMGSNLCLQYGAARLSATTTAVIMPMEVLFAALTAVWWGGAHLSANVLWGGALILGAALASLVE